MAGSSQQGDLVGRLGQDPESQIYTRRHGPSKLRIATDENWKDRAATPAANEWHTVVRLAQTGGNLRPVLSKGRLVYIEGKLQTRSWQDREETSATPPRFRRQHGHAGGGRSEEGQAAAPAQPAAAAAAGSCSGTSDDDIPFSPDPLPGHRQEIGLTDFSPETGWRTRPYLYKATHIEGGGNRALRF